MVIMDKNMRNIRPYVDKLQNFHLNAIKLAQSNNISGMWWGSWKMH